MSGGTTSVYKNENGEWECKFVGIDTTVVKPMFSRKIDAMDLCARDSLLLEKQMLMTLRTFSDHERLVIVLGPGRCGTLSLATLLAGQRDFMAHHEFAAMLWEISIPHFVIMMIKLLYDLKPRLDRVSDCGPWYIQYVELIRSIFPKAKFVCMWRDPEEVFESWMKRDVDTCHWTSTKSKHWKPEWKRNFVYRGCFPRYDLPKEEALRKYIKEYYQKAKMFERQYGDFFKMFDVESLNTEEGVISILDFIDIEREDMNVVVGIRSNTQVRK